MKETNTNAATSAASEITNVADHNSATSVYVDDTNFILL